MTEKTVNALEFEDRDIAEARKGYDNIIVSIGCLGSQIVTLNPASVKEAIENFENEFERKVDEGDEVKIISFNKMFQAYDVNKLER